METKKIQETNLECRKPMFWQVGLAIVVVVLLMSFDFVDAKEKVETDVITTIVKQIPDSLKDNQEVFMIVEQLPTFPEGEEAFSKFLSENIVYPQQAREAGIEGRVMVGFIVESDGEITNVKVLRSIDPVLDEEAIRVIKMMPKWNPGKLQGKAVRVQYQVPITFSLQ